MYMHFIRFADVKSDLKFPNDYNDLISHIKDNQKIIEWVYNLKINLNVRQIYGL